MYFKSLFYYPLKHVSGMGAVQEQGRRPQAGGLGAGFVLIRTPQANGLGPGQTHKVNWKAGQMASITPEGNQEDQMCWWLLKLQQEVSKKVTGGGLLFGV